MNVYEEYLMSKEALLNHSTRKGAIGGAALGGLGNTARGYMKGRRGKALLADAGKGAAGGAAVGGALGYGYSKTPMGKQKEHFEDLKNKSTMQHKKNMSQINSLNEQADLMNPKLDKALNEGRYEDFERLSKEQHEILMKMTKV